MQLTPVSTNATGTEMPSKTWKIDFENNQITGTTDGLDALRQAIFLCLNSERYEHVIYSRDYGAELKNLVGKSIDLVRQRLQSNIQEALHADDRITSMGQFTFSQNADSLTVAFTVTSSDGSVIIEEEYHV
ncbi:MAG: hypothetical protein H6Q60_1424 [Oscillospiraceae bacterium]|nr:hypothetical protein [Oscillospiraceae bacterium]